jgi:3-oxoadipate enol-lactonase
MPQVDVNGIKTEYRVDGKESAPYVTFVTGIANDHTLWDPQVEALGKDFRILRYDLRGHGDTQATQGDYSMDLLVNDLLGLLNELNIQKTHLVGLGLGGAIVQAFAIANSHRVNALAPCCCRARMVPDFAALWQKLRAAVAKDGVEVIVEPTVQRWFSDDFKAANPQVIQNVRNMIRGTTTFGYLGVTAAFLGLDLEDKLGQIKAPTLYISGAEDKIGGPSELMSELAKKVPGAQHRSIEKAAHIANIQNPTRYNAVLGDFLRRQR